MYAMNRPASGPSPGLLAAAPHRLMFFIGAGNLLLAMAWWAAWLSSQRWPGLMQVPQAATYPGWLHAFVMQYQVLPSFFFGFLLTVFPRWMGLSDIARVRYLPVGIGLFGGQLLTIAGAFGWAPGIKLGFWLTLAGWLVGVATLGPMLWRERGTTWTARACFGGLVLGVLGMLAWGAYLHGGDARLAFASIKIGTFGLLLPVYFSVAHRMFPFFAANVVAGYAAWRPMWLLGAVLALCLAHLGLELVHAYGWLWLADVPLLALLCLTLWKWWPR